MITQRKTRAAIDGGVLIAIGIVLVAGWLFGPSLSQRRKTREVDKLEQKLEAKKSETTAQDSKQLEVAHQLIAGTNEALSRVPAEHRTPEVALGAELAEKAESALAAGRNTDLAPALRAAIKETVTLALSPVLEENKRGRERIADLEKGLNASVDRETQLRGEIATLTGKLNVATGEAMALAATVDAWGFYAKWGFLAFVVIAWVLPTAAKFFPALEPLSRGGQWLISQAGGAAMNTLNATVRGIERVRTRLKQSDVPEALRNAIDAELKEEIYDAHDSRVQQIRKAEGLA
ncbi:hypothetical protein [Oleiharenicola lentus]|uniref:hypothetical protein n=1 Tax=Oleiharenicola lentus TaxID=2508720 RepID=UPI003F6643EF